LLANAVAQGQIDRQVAKDESALSGISGERFDQLVQVFDTGPGVGAAFELRRRGLIDDAGFRRAVKREGVEDEWIADLLGLVDVLLSPAELANAVVQGHRSQADAAVDAAKQGVPAADFQTLVDNTGLPPGPETLLAWWRRGIIDQAQFEQGIREGHTKVKYIDPYERARAPVLSHVAYAGLRLRGWLTKAESDAGGALTGYTPEQMELEYLNRGRPATAHQIHIGYARGAKLAGAANEEAAIRTSVQQSDIRPEYADLIVAQRYSYPSAFVLRALVQSGDISRDEGEEALLFSGWEPTFAAKVADAWSGKGGASGGSAYVGKAETQMWTATHRSYVTGTIDRAAAESALTKLEPDAAARGQVLDLWDAERDVTVKSLTPTQVKSAYTNSIVTLDTALAELARLGYDQESAARLLGTVSQAPTISQIMAQVEADVRAGTVDTVEAIDRLRSAGLTTQNASGLVGQWQGGGSAPA
jgi:hypothetical protein